MLLNLSMYAGDPPNPNKPPPHPELSIDGGIAFLFIVGIVYGIYHIKKKTVKKVISANASTN